MGNMVGSYGSLGASNDVQIAVPTAPGASGG